MQTKKLILFLQISFFILFWCSAIFAQPHAIDPLTELITYISEDPGFVKAPAVKAEEMHNAVFQGSTAYEVGWDYSDPPYDFSYSTASASYTAAAGDFPLGDLNWFPDKKAEWEAWIETDVEKTTNRSVKDFVLEQNYPNPFNPNKIFNFKTGSGFSGHL